MRNYETIYGEQLGHGFLRPTLPQVAVICLVSEAQAWQTLLCKVPSLVMLGGSYLSSRSLLS